jgi:hypothetical protein
MRDKKSSKSLKGTTNINDLQKQINALSVRSKETTSTTTTEVVKLKDEDVGDGLKVEEEKLNLNLGDGLEVQDEMLNLNLGEGLSIISKKVVVNVGDGIEIDDDKVKIKTYNDSLQVTSAGLGLKTIGEVHYNFHQPMSGKEYDMPDDVGKHCVSYSTEASSGYHPHAENVRASQWDIRANSIFDMTNFITKDNKTLDDFVYDNGEANGSITIECNVTDTHRYIYGFGIIDLSKSGVGEQNHYTVEVEVEADDVIEINVNGQFIGGDQRERWHIVKDTSNNIVYVKDGSGNNITYKNLDNNYVNLPHYAMVYDGISFTKKRRGVVIIGRYLYFNYSGVTWVDNKDPNFKLTFRVRSGWS